MIVIDCSYAMAIVMPDERRPATVDVVERSPLLAPAIWPLEMANALRSSLRRGRLRESDVGGLCADVDRLGVEVPRPSGLARVAEAYAAAMRHELSAYDATYLELAAQRGAALATLDVRLAAQAARLGLTILQ